MISPELTYRIALASLRPMAPALARRLIGITETEERFFAMSARQLAAVAGFNNRLFDDTLRERVLREARNEVEFINANHIRPVYFTDPDYPRRLLECDDAPLMLYVLGETDFNSGLFASVVGTRHATPYGLDFVSSLVSGLASGVAEPPAIVSGLAYGIDIAAHKAALDAGLPTVAVLAHGLNTIYPSTHRSTAVSIVRNGGALVSEYRSCDAIHRGNFLARNRIVAGLSDCTIVDESDIKGGALVTAKLANNYSRDVMALPGRTSDRYSRGCNALIASNIAQLVTCADDVAAAMNWPVKEPEGTQQELFTELTPEEERVCDILRDRGEASLNDLIARIDTPAPRLMGLLIDMEFKNLILALPGSRYRLL